MEKHLHLLSITYYLRTYGAFFTLDIKATMYYYFLSQWYERDYVLFIQAEKDAKYALLYAIQALQHIPWFKRSFGSEV